MAKNRDWIRKQAEEIRELVKINASFEHVLEKMYLEACKDQCADSIYWTKFNMSGVNYKALPRDSVLKDAVMGIKVSQIKEIGN